MKEEFLDDTDVDAAVDQVGVESVAERVWREFPVVDACPEFGLGDEVGDRRRLDGSVATVARGEPPARRHGPGDLAKHGVEGYSALLAAFRKGSDGVREVVDVVAAHARDLGDAEALQVADEDHDAGAAVGAAASAAT